MGLSGRLSSEERAYSLNSELAFACGMVCVGTESKVGNAEILGSKARLNEIDDGKPLNT